LTTANGGPLEEEQKQHYDLLINHQPLQPQTLVADWA